jgi:tRNA(fMet)-specific endonuclease VapC
MVEDFDLLIGSTAVQGGFTMVTENTRHFQNIEGIQLENWVVR